MNLKKNNLLKYLKNIIVLKFLLKRDNPNEALKILEDLILKKNKFYSPSALNLIIDKELIKDKKKVLFFFDEIISNNKLDTETKNLFIFKKIVFIGDDIKENELLSNLKPILKSDSLWKGTVSDYIKKYYLSKGEFIKAKEFRKYYKRMNKINYLIIFFF